jgi:hypothetical protein
VEQNKVLIPPAWNKTFAWGYADLSCRLGTYESDKVTPLPSSPAPSQSQQPGLTGVGGWGGGERGRENPDQALSAAPPKATRRTSRCRQERAGKAVMLPKQVALEICEVGADDSPPPLPEFS